MAKENKQKTGEMRIPTDELEKEYQESLEVTKFEIQTRAEAETTAELDQEEMIKKNEEILATPQIDNVQPAESNPDYLEFAAEAVGYENRTHQWAVYHTVVGYLEENDSVIDFGCGRGDFERFYQTEYHNDLDYIGIDMNQQLIDAGNSAYNNEVDLRCLDWFKIPEDMIADWTINVNSNNLRYDADTKRKDKQYLKDTIDKMYQHAEKGVIIMLASTLTKIDDGLINYNPGDILNWAQEKYKNCALDHSISSDLFTLIIYKNKK